MVTIEQKLTLFSKLLNQEIKDETDKEKSALDKEYERLITENKYRVDKEAKGIIDSAKRRAETKKVELISKGKLSSKKEGMLTTEKVIQKFMAAIKDRVHEFVKTPAYKEYLSKLVSDVTDLKDYENEVVVYLTQTDYENNKDFLKEELVKNGLKADKLTFEETKEDILGGFVIKDPVLDMKVDESIRTVLDESKDYIIELVTEAIGEEGDTVEQ